MGIRMPGVIPGIDPQTVEQLVQLEKIPVDNAKKRKETVVNEKKEVEKLQTKIDELDSAVKKLQTRGDFNKLKVESSHPDILDGIVSGSALLGNYEFEVRGLARAEKELAYGFPDKDETPVGFGYMLVERDDKEPLELVVEPDMTLQDVANKINDAQAGVRAMVINTKYKPDPYRLLVVSEQSGEEARITIDEDTTYLEFKEQVTGRNLDVLFEDVPVTDTKNSLDELVEGVVFNAKRAEPGTKVEVNITYDVDKTIEGIKGFVDKYNEVAKYIHDQFVVDKDSKRAGVLAGDSSLKTILRQLQSQLIDVTRISGKYNNLSDIGITTEPKTGILQMDESKVKQALAEDYESVARLFIRANDGTPGVADRISQALKGLKDPQAGVLKSRLRGLENIIKNQDQDIERRERTMEQRQESVRQRFINLGNKMAGLQSQGAFLAQRLGGAQGGGGGGGGGQGGAQGG